jgi:hypothetical protein
MGTAEARSVGTRSCVGTVVPSPVMTISPGCEGTSNASGFTDGAMTWLISL